MSWANHDYFVAQLYCVWYINTLRGSIHFSDWGGGGGGKSKENFRFFGALHAQSRNLKLKIVYLLNLMVFVVPDSAF